MRVGDCKAIRSQAYVPQACCFCEAVIPVGDKVIKFVERPGQSHEVVITYGCLRCWRELSKSPIPQPAEAARSDAR